MNRRDFLVGAGVTSLTTLTGCVGALNHLNKSPDEGEPNDTSTKLENSRYYLDSWYEIKSDDSGALNLQVADDLNMNEDGDGFVKADSMVLFKGKKYITDRTPVSRVSTYQFPLLGDGEYTVVTTGSAAEGTDFSSTYEIETTLELDISQESISVRGIYYTSKKESPLA